jgi:hypothetical protein
LEHFCFLFGTHSTTGRLWKDNATEFPEMWNLEDNLEVLIEKTFLLLHTTMLMGCF